MSRTDCRGLLKLITYITKDRKLFFSKKVSFCNLDNLLLKTFAPDQQDEQDLWLGHCPYTEYIIGCINDDCGKHYD